MFEKSRRIDQKIQRGMGKEASKLGLKFDVYRRNQLYTPSVFLKVQRTTQRDAIDVATSLRDIIFVRMICDATNFKPGDVFQGEDPQDRYVFSYKWPAKGNIGFRCEQTLTISRPHQGDPDANNIAPYGGQIQTTNLPLVYDPTTHTYSFTEGEAATVYCSKSRQGASGVMSSNKLPLDIKDSAWIFALELLPGVELKPDDLLNYQNEVYQVQSVDTQRYGFAGQLVYANLKRP